MVKVRRIDPFRVIVEDHANVPVLVYATDILLKKMLEDRTLQQALNVASLPGVKERVLVMPDGHEGYGFPIGGVAAFDVDTGVVSPGGIGYDINCGVRLLLSPLTVEDVKPSIKQLVSELFKAVPSGVGATGHLRLSREEFIEAVTKGIDWAITEGYATKEDKKHIEEYGSFRASSDFLSEKAIKRGMPQLGTLGAGNHFLEVQKVEKIFDPETAKVFGLFEGQVVVMIHTGSRGFGHQVASDFIKVMLNASRKYGIKLPDPELAAAPIKSDEAERYLLSMGAAINFAFLNRQLITYWTREVFKRLYGAELKLLYDVAHNIGKFEEHNGEEVFIHRKGATRAFGKGRKELPEDYRSIGQPVLIPGSMGTASYVLLGLGSKESFESTCHGAGRVMSRAKAKKKIWGKEVKSRLEAMGIAVKAASMPILAEEAPEVYKDIDEVVKVVEAVGISRAVARLRPMGVIKG